MDRRRRDLERTFTERPRRWLEDLRVGRLDPWRLELAGYLGLDDARQLLSDLGYRARRSPWTLIQLEDAEPWAQAQTLEDLALTPSDAPDSPHSAPLRATPPVPPVAAASTATVARRAVPRAVILGLTQVALTGRLETKFESFWF